MPTDPTSRAKARVMISRLRRDWLDDVQRCMSSGAKLDKSLNRSLSDGLVAMSNHFSENKHALGEEFSLVDAYLAVLLWRLTHLQVNLPRQGAKMLDYGKRLLRSLHFKEASVRLNGRCAPTDADIPMVAEDTALSSHRPYLIRAIREWAMTTTRRRNC